MREISDGFHEKGLYAEFSGKGWVRVSCFSLNAGLPMDNHAVLQNLQCWMAIHRVNLQLQRH